jgi:glycosyltransferase involved in cell wall biosynthesis
VNVPWASVVVPVFNTEKWLRAALDSVDRQDCRDRLEVVIVDDGSTDGCGAIADEYARRAANVTVVHQPNAGLGAARNRGMAEATGRYLAFLDSDDLYPAGALSALLTRADRHEAQIAVGDMHGLPPRSSPRWRREILAGERVITSVAEAPDLVGNPSACNKVFLREFVVSSGIRFTEKIAFEDVLFTVPLLLRATTTVITPVLVYLYRHRTDGSSIMDTRDQPAKIMQHLTIVERLMAELDHADAAQRRAVHRWVSYMQIHYARRAASAMNDEQLAEFTTRMSALFKEIDVDTASEYAVNLVAGLRTVGMYEQDPRLVRAPLGHGELRVVGQHCYVDHPSFARYRPMLQLAPTHVTFTALRADRSRPGSLIVHGRWYAPGVGVTPGETRHDVLVEVGDVVARSPIEIVKTVDHTIHWISRLPLDTITRGGHWLRLVVRDQGGEVIIPRDGAHGGVRPAGLRRRRRVWLEPGRVDVRLVVTRGVVPFLARTPLWAVFGANRQARAGLRQARQLAKWVLRRGGTR